LLREVARETNRTTPDGSDGSPFADRKPDAFASRLFFLLDAKLLERGAIRSSPDVSSSTLERNLVRSEALEGTMADMPRHLAFAINQFL
jgi:hypothetical protein